jgi:hypothetical protein
MALHGTAPSAFWVSSESGIQRGQLTPAYGEVSSNTVTWSNPSVIGGTATIGGALHHQPGLGSRIDGFPIEITSAIATGGQFPSNRHSDLSNARMHPLDGLFDSDEFWTVEGFGQMLTGDDSASAAMHLANSDDLALYDLILFAGPLLAFHSPDRRVARIRGESRRKSG